MAIAVKNLMCIPATSSTLTDAVTAKRNKLKGETTHMLTFLKHNLYIIPAYTENKHRTQSQNDNKPSTSQEIQENVDETLPDLEEI